jgi:phosphohistidine phosphatase
MLTLSLFRHAKSSRDDPRREDFDRPLDGRGRAAAPRMGAFMRGADINPDVVMCSTAVRTRETAALAFAEFPQPPTVIFDKALYHATTDKLLEILGGLRAKTKHVMIVGHNPGLEDLAVRLIGEGPAEARDRIAQKFPTAALAVIDFDQPAWKNI